MKIKCNDNDGFSDQLTNNRIYKVKEIGHNGYLIENDNGVCRWYGLSKFGPGSEGPSEYD
jgi:hypothetical protein